MLSRLLDFLPELRIVMLRGGTAKKCWRKFERQNPQITQRYEVIPTYHTSRQALWAPDPDERARREANLRDAYTRAAELLAAE